MASKTSKAKTVVKMSATRLAELVADSVSKNEHHVTANWLCDRVGKTNVFCVQFCAWLPTAQKNSDGSFTRDDKGKIFKVSEFKNRRVYVGVRDDGESVLFQHYYPKSVSAGKVPEFTPHHTIRNVAGVLVQADLTMYRKLCVYMGIPTDITGKSPEHTLELYHGKLTSWVRNNASLLMATRTQPPTSGSASTERGVRIAFEL